MAVLPIRGFLAKLRSSDLVAGLPDEEIEHIAEVSHHRSVGSGHTICCQGNDGESMFVILAGRVRVRVRQDHGETITLNHLGPGDHFGELSMLTGSPRTATVVATMDTELLELSRSDFHNLMSSIPGFAANVGRTLGNWLRREIAGCRRVAVTTTVGLVRSGRETDQLAPRIAQALSGGGEYLQVVTDRPEQWPRSPRIALLPIPKPKDDRGMDWCGVARRMLLGAQSAGERVLLDIDLELADPALLMQCELIWWPIPTDEPSVVQRRLEDCLEREPRLNKRSQLIWLVRTREDLPSFDEFAADLHHPSVRIGWSGDGRLRAEFRPADVARLIHRIDGIHLGLALGGGGARGVAHVGVLRALENEGIYFDRIAGTSAGAMVGSMYAAGYSVEQLLEMFETELTPPSWMRWLPRHKRWYLLAMYRLGLTERKLRRHLHDYTFRQLLTPMHTVSVDLISGSERVRETDDVVNAVLESINLPLISAPILRDGDALVDGGVLVNVPATVLRKRQANFIVAVDVGSQLAPQFGGNTSSTPAAEMKKPGVLETIIRITEVQQRGLASIHASDADFILTPDTSRYPFDDFTQARRLVEVGQAAAEAAMPELKQLLADLTPTRAPSLRRAA